MLLLTPFCSKTCSCLLPCPMFCCLPIWDHLITRQATRESMLQAQLPCLFFHRALAELRSFCTALECVTIAATLC
jgi:hypothetical protein